MLGIIQKTAPFYLVTYFLWSVLGGLSNFFSSTYLLRYSINSYQSGKGITHVLLFVGIVTSEIFIFYAAVNFLNFLLYPRYRRRIVAKIEKLLFNKAKDVELSCYEDPTFYDKYVRSMTDCYGKCMNTVYNVDSFVWSLTTITANGIMLFVIDPLLIVFALFPLLLGLVEKKRNTVLHDFDCKRNPIDRKIGYVQRTFYLGEYAKEMRLGSMYKNMFGQQKEGWLAYKKLIADYGFPKAALKFIINFGRDGVVVLGAMLYATFRTLVTKDMMLGDCIVVLTSIAALSNIITGLVTDITDFYKNALYIEDMRYFLDYEPKIVGKGEKVPRKGKIHFEKVGFSYTGAAAPSLTDITFDVNPGEKIALVGKNGSGKSTLVKLMLRLYDPTEGEISCGGRPVSELDLKEYRERFAVVFQDFKLFSMSVAENVLMRPLDGTESERELVKRALMLSGGYERVEKMPKGIDTTLTREFDDEGVNLSGGEGQKVALARIFAKPSEIVIVDEPSAALDPIAEYKLFENLLLECKDKSMIFISHRLSSAVLADKVIYLEDGHLTEMGSHSELMKKGGAYATLFSKQAENYLEDSDAEGNSLLYEKGD